MSRRGKGEDRIVMIIRGLLKQPENRRCINCNNLGPQYVCTTFWTFVCANCSGVHRGFTHRVKSVSVAKFSEEETAALEACGNKRAREIYFKDWNPQRDHYPDRSNTQKLREFIKHVYIDKKYAGSNSSSKDAANKTEDRYGIQKLGGGSNKDEFADRCFIDQKSSILRNKGRSFRDIFEERSSINMEEDLRCSRQRTRVAKLEIVDDRFREDGNVKRYERYLGKDSRAGSMSPCSGRSSSLPKVCAVEDLIGNKVVLEIGGSMTFAKDMKATETPFQAQSIELKANEVKESKSSAKEPNMEIPTVPRPATQLKMKTHTGAVNSNCLFDESTSLKPQTDANLPKMTSLESLLYELPEPVSTTSSSVTEEQASSPKEIGVESTRPSQVSNGADATKKDGPTRLNAGDPMLQDARQLLPGLKNKALISSESPNIISMERNVTSPKAELNNQEDNSAVPKEPTPSKGLFPVNKASKTLSTNDDGIKISARKELPQDLFWPSFGSFTPEVVGWHMHHPPGTRYAVQPRLPVTLATDFQYVPSSRNPFDIGDERLQVEAPRFPSIQPLQSLPNNLHSQSLAPQQYPYPSSFSSQITMAPVPGAYTGQLTDNMQFTRPLGVAGLGSYSSFSCSNTIHQPKGGNPFG